ncbi:hypothetical protein K8R66_02105 [bacterium]|nr:hypothetical protein [bacterium]
MKSKTLLKIIILIFILLIPNLYLVSSAEAENNNYNNLNNYLEYFYNRYSDHFHQNGLKYSVPSYGVVDFETPQKAREWIALTSYYKYKALKDESSQTILKLGILNTYRELSQRPKQSQSFADSEAHFLTLRMIETVPNLFKESQKDKILSIINNYLEEGIKAPDTENRAIIAGAHWQYIVNYLFEKQIINSQEKNYYNNLIKRKIDSAIKKSINSDNWYLENKMTDFSVHYHTVSAFMLMVYGDLSEQKEYLDTAEKMYHNIKKISFHNGLVETQLGHRPIGVGAQFYLMQGLLGKYFNDSDYMVYLFYASGNKFFSDPKYPNRLEFHSTTINSDPEYHDDYAFSDVAELGLIIPKFKNIDLYYRSSFYNPIFESADKTFDIKNNGQEIVFNDQKNTLHNSNYSSITNKVKIYTQHEEDISFQLNTSFIDINIY